MTLQEAVRLVMAHADSDGWLIRVTGDISGFPNALIPSTENALTSDNYRAKMRNGKRRQARQQVFHLEALRDPASVKGTGGSKLYAARVESGVVTRATWLMIQALPAAVRDQYEHLVADSIIFYPRDLAASDGEEFDELVGRYRNDELPWQSELDLEGMELVRREKIDADYVTLQYPIGEFARIIAHYREEAQEREGKGSGADLAWKQHGNTMYGVLASAHLPTNNFVAANVVTAHGRVEAFALGQALNAIQTITDGCTYRLDQIPACTYEECLRLKPDYPICRAENGDGIPFLNPNDIPSDDAGFTAWYRKHVKRFFGVTDPEYDDLFGTHGLEHKKTGVSKSVAFDALACDGSGNYVKCTRTPEGSWRVEDIAARAYGKESKKVLAGWLVGSYSKDQQAGLSPLAEDQELLSFKRAAQLARRALDAGLLAVYFPLGLANVKVGNYRALKASAFIFQTPEQRAAVLRQWQKFEDETGAGLEVLALRRSYGGRREGSLRDVAEAVYHMIREGRSNLGKELNLSKQTRVINEVARPRAAELERHKAEAGAGLFARIDVGRLEADALLTGFLVRAEDIRVVADSSVVIAGSAGEIRGVSGRVG